MLTMPQCLCRLLTEYLFQDGLGLALYRLQLLHYPCLDNVSSRNVCWCHGQRDAIDGAILPT